jgi:maltooligosyltrehalose trehalohydrolase
MPPRPSSTSPITRDPELGRVVSEGRRAEFASFGWKPGQVPDPQSPDTFAHSKLDWDEVAQAPHAGLLAWYRALIALRRATPAFTDARLDRGRVSYDQAARCLTMRRGSITLACNFAATARPVPLPPSSWRLRLASPGKVALAANAVTLPGESVANLEALELAQA